MVKCKTKFFFFVKKLYSKLLSRDVLALIMCGQTERVPIPRKNMPGTEYGAMVWRECVGKPGDDLSNREKSQC